LVLIFLLSFLFHCKKENDQGPVIRFIYPVSNLQLSVNDSIYIEAEISDDNFLEKVSIQLLDQNENPVEASIVYHPNNNSFHISTLYHVNNSLLESGNYLLAIKASDGKNISKSAIVIGIQALPIERLKVFALTGSGTSVNVHLLDSSVGYTLFSNIQGDYLDASISSRQKRLNILGRSQGPFTVLNANTGALVKEISGNCVIASPCFENLQFQNELNFISYSDGSVKAFNGNGIQNFELEEDGYFRPGDVCLNGDYLFVELHYLNPPENKIGAFFYPSGVATLEAPLDMDILEMYERTDFEVYLIGHSNGRAYIKTFSRLTNSLNSLMDLGAMKINSVYNFESTRFFLATDHGLWVYSIHAPPNSLSNITPTPLQQVNYDPVYNEFYLAENDQIRVLDCGNFSEKKIYNLPDSVLNVLFLYSR
jgi:hypothetical protein